MNNQNYLLIDSGSGGNCLIYRNEVCVDMGVKYDLIKEHLDSIKYIFMTHWHKDHFNKVTIKRIVREYPHIMFVCAEHFIDLLESVNVSRDIMFVCNVGEVYDFGTFKFSPVYLYHDVPNVGYRFIFKSDGYKILHATDTAHLDGIVAKGYDLYALESNYDELRIEQEIEEKLAKGEFAYEIGAKNSHLSFQQTADFFNKMKSDKSELLKLHISHKYKGEQV